MGKYTRKASVDFIMRKILFLIFTLLTALLFTANGMSPLRLHIIANSNSLEDQQLKLEVRDCILQEKAIYWKIVEINSRHNKLFLRMPKRWNVLPMKC